MTKKYAFITLALVLFSLSFLLFGGVSKALYIKVNQVYYLYGIKDLTGDAAGLGRIGAGKGSEKVYNNGTASKNCVEGSTWCIFSSTSSETYNPPYNINAKPTLTAKAIDTPSDQWWFYYFKTVPTNNIDPCDGSSGSFEFATKNHTCGPITSASGLGLSADTVINAVYHSYHNAVALSAETTTGVNLCLKGGNLAISSDKIFHKTGDSTNYNSTTLCNVNDGGFYTVAQTDPVKMDNYKYQAPLQYLWNSEKFRFKEWQTNKGNISSLKCDHTGSRNYCPIPDVSTCVNGWTGQDCYITADHQPTGTLITAKAIYVPVYNLNVTVTGSGNVSSSPAGINCPPTCTKEYDHGTSVTLTATPNSGYFFTGWAGNCTGNSPTCTLTMDAAKNVTATFLPIPVNNPPNIDLNERDCQNKRIRVRISDADGGTSRVEYSVHTPSSASPSYSSVQNSNDFYVDMSGYDQYDLHTLYVRTKGTTPANGSESNYYYASRVYGRSDTEPCLYRQFVITPSGSVSYNIVFGETYPYTADFSSSISVDLTPDGGAGVKSTITRRYFIDKLTGPDVDLTPAPIPSPDTNAGSPFTEGTKNYSADLRTIPVGSVVSGDKICVSISITPQSGYVNKYGDVKSQDNNGNPSPPVNYSTPYSPPYCKTVPWAFQINPSASLTPIDEETWESVDYSTSQSTLYNCNRIAYSPNTSGCNEIPSVRTGDNGNGNGVNGFITNRVLYRVPSGSTTESYNNCQPSDVTSIDRGNCPLNPAAEAGDDVCIKITIMPGRGLVDENGTIIRSHGNIDAKDCERRSNHPYFKVFQGGAGAGSCFKPDGGGTCDPKPTTTIQAYSYITSPRPSEQFVGRTYSAAEPTSVKCDSGINGDPAPNYPKACFWRDPWPTPEVSDYAFCAEEASVGFGVNMCQFNGRADVVYVAADNSKHYKNNQVSPVACTALNFVVGQQPPLGSRGNCHFKPLNTQIPTSPSSNPAGSPKFIYCAQENETCYFGRRNRPVEVKFGAITGECIPGTYLVRGSSAQYAVQAYKEIRGGGIKGFYSNSQQAGCVDGSAPANINPKPGHLTFASNNFNPPDLGGNFGTVRRMPDYFKNTQSASLNGNWSPYTTCPSDRMVDLSRDDRGYPRLNGFDTGKQYVISRNGGTCSNLNFGTLTRPVGDMDTGNRRFTIYTDSDVLIHSNLVNDVTRIDPGSPLYSSPLYDKPENIPYVTIIAKGDIYISKNVTKLTGLFIAQPRPDDPSTPQDETAVGQIFTCADVAYDDLVTFRTTKKEVVADSNKFAQCGGVAGTSGPLKVYGALIANKVNMHRTFSSLRFSRSIIYVNGVQQGLPETPTSNNAGEMVQFLSEFQIGSPVFGDALNSNSKNSGFYDSYISRPPTF